MQVRGYKKLLEQVSGGSKTVTTTTATTDLSIALRCSFVRTRVAGCVFCLSTREHHDRRQWRGCVINDRATVFFFPYFHPVVDNTRGDNNDNPFAKPKEKENLFFFSSILFFSLTLLRRQWIDEE